MHISESHQKIYCEFLNEMAALSSCLNEGFNELTFSTNDNIILADHWAQSKLKEVDTVRDLEAIMMIDAIILYIYYESIDRQILYELNNQSRYELKIGAVDYILKIRIVNNRSLICIFFMFLFWFCKFFFLLFFPNRMTNHPIRSPRIHMYYGLIKE